MVKIRGKQKPQIEPKTRKLNENRGNYKFLRKSRREFINFVEIGGICKMHHWGMDASGRTS